MFELVVGHSQQESYFYEYNLYVIYASALLAFYLQEIRQRRVLRQQISETLKGGCGHEYEHCAREKPGEDCGPCGFV
jgi:hypothetical protein